jgi:hypothetical protein
MLVRVPLGLLAVQGSVTVICAFLVLPLVGLVLQEQIVVQAHVLGVCVLARQTLGLAQLVQVAVLGCVLGLHVFRAYLQAIPVLTMGIVAVVLVLAVFVWCLFQERRWGFPVR